MAIVIKLKVKAKSPTLGPDSFALLQWMLELFVKIAGRAGDVDSAGDAALTVFDPLHDAGGFAALGTVG
jgi:hypothetical protein